MKILIKRCNKITELDLRYCTSITNDSVDNIATYLKSLEKLYVSYTKIDSTALLQLRSVGTLKVLCCLKATKFKEIKNLKKNLPQVSFIVGEEMFNTIASPSESQDHDEDGFQEIKADIQESFINV